MSIQIIDFMARLPNNWQPRSAMQKAALVCPAEVLLLGGAAGSLKSTTLLVDALKYYQNPKYNGIVYRKTYPEMEFLIARSRDFYSQTGGRFMEGHKEWRWPWGAVLKFRHMGNDQDVHKHQGPEYQYVGFDESTHFKEFQVRYILNSRMRSTEGIPLRMRLATNPGNVGHGYHKSIFIGPKCLHCLEKEAEQLGRDIQYLPGSRQAGKIYDDAKWPDGVRIEHTTCFLPGRVDRHTLFGEGGGDYAKKLRGLPQKLKEALLHGCWEAFEGQYFDCFDRSVHIVQLTDVPVKDSWPHWVSIDYGFGHACAAYLWAMNPQTRVIYTLDEYLIHRRKAVDVAADLKLLWGDRNIRAWYLSHDAFDHDGTEDFSRAELMSKATGIYYDRAYNDRVSGAMLMYTMLSEGRWFICAPNVELLPQALQTRVHAEKDAEDIEKVVTEDEDDAYDAARYGLASHINPRHKSKQEELLEKITNGDFAEDPTVRMMQIKQELQKGEKAGKGHDYRGRAR